MESNLNNTTTLSDALKDVATVMAPLKNKIQSNRKFVSTILHFLSGVNDFREPHKIRYNLENILCICLLLAMQGNFTSFAHAASCIKLRVSYFKYLKLIDGENFPSHDTLRRIFMYIDAKELRDVIISRFNRMIDKITDSLNSKEKPKIRLLSGDGKMFNGSGRKNGASNKNVFNFFDASRGICLLSVTLDDKESEIPAFQYILKRFKLDNSMITADALHCQRKTCQIITDKNGLYTFKVKDNQLALKEHMTFVMDKNKDKCIKKSFNNCDYEIFILDYPITEQEFPGTKAFVRMVSHKRKDQQDYNPETQYFISSADNVQLIIEAIDNRWRIESGLHKFKDTSLNEDECTFMDKNCIEVMATLNNIVYTLYCLAAAIFHNEVINDAKTRFEHNPEELLALIVPLMEKQNLSKLLKENMRGRKKCKSQG